MKSGNFPPCGAIFHDNFIDFHRFGWKNRAEGAKKLGGNFRADFSPGWKFLAKIEGGNFSAADKKNIGIWVGDKNNSMKIAAIGIRVKKWIAYHGFALNICNDLSKYNGIVPCGIKDKGITNFKKLGINKYNNIDKIIAKKFLNIFL